VPAGLLVAADQHGVRCAWLGALGLCSGRGFVSRAQPLQGSCCLPLHHEEKTNLSNLIIDMHASNKKHQPHSAPTTPPPPPPPQQEADKAGTTHPRYSSDIEMAYTVMDFLFASQVRRRRRVRE